MTSEPDSTPRRGPPTIDLTAKEVQTSDPDPALGSATDRAEGRTAHGTASSERKDSRFLASVPYVVGAILGVIAVGAIMAALWMAGMGSPQRTEAPGGPTAKAASTDELSSRLDKIQQALQAPQADQAIAARMAAAETQTKALSESLAAVSRRLDDVAAAAQSALAQAGATADGAKNAATVVQQSDIDALNQRIAALESTIKSLSTEVTQRTSSADDHATRLAVAAEALSAAVERGAPYQAELAAVRALGADQNATASLEPFSASGLPSDAALAQEFVALAPALLQASGAAPAETSFLGRLEAHAQKLVRIAPINAPAGDDPSSVIARINFDASHGDIAAALADNARLPAPARALAAAWVKKAEARETALAASRRIAADALAAIGGLAPQ